VNGKKVDEDYFEFMHISTYSLAETFDVGMDSGTQVDKAYEGDPFEFTGIIDRVIVTLTD
jgi:arylsulfatase